MRCLTFKHCGAVDLVTGTGWFVGVYPNLVTLICCANVKIKISHIQVSGLVV